MSFVIQESTKHRKTSQQHNFLWDWQRWRHFAKLLFFCCPYFKADNTERHSDTPPFWTQWILRHGNQCWISGCRRSDWRGDHLGSAAAFSELCCELSSHLRPRLTNSQVIILYSLVPSAMKALAAGKLWYRGHGSWRQSNGENWRSGWAVGGHAPWRLLRLWQ